MYPEPILKGAFIVNTTAEFNEQQNNPEFSRSAASRAGERAAQVADQAKGFVSQQVDQRSTDLGNQLSTHVDSLRAVGNGLRSQGQETPAKLAEVLAERAEGVAQYLKSANGDRVLRDIENMGRRQPWLALTAGVALGFVASRFLKATSAERYRYHADADWSYNAASAAPHGEDYAGSSSQRSMKYYED